MSVALPSKSLLLVFVDDVVEEDLRTICAFCFKTSAGVRMKHDTSSPVEEASACMTAVGNNGVPEGRQGLVVWRTDLVASYVVKNAPAGEHQPSPDHRAIVPELETEECLFSQDVVVPYMKEV